MTLVNIPRYYRKSFFLCDAFFLLWSSVILNNVGRFSNGYSILILPLVYHLCVYVSIVYVCIYVVHLCSGMMFVYINKYRGLRTTSGIVPQVLSRFGKVALFVCAGGQGMSLP